MVALDDAGRYAGPVSVAEAHLETPGAERVADLLRPADRVLLQAMSAKEATAVSAAAEAEALAVVDGRDTRRVIGLLTVGEIAGLSDRAYRCRKSGWRHNLKSDKSSNVSWSHSTAAHMARIALAPA
jgi:hypothetical protein